MSEEDLFGDSEQNLVETTKVDTGLSWDGEESWEGLTEEKKVEKVPVKKEKKDKTVKKPTTTEKKEEPVKQVKTKKPKEGMLGQLEKDLSEMRVTEELFENEDKVTRIDLLKPRTQKDFDLFSEIISNKILEFENDKKFYTSLLKDMITRTTINMKSAELKDLGIFVTSLSNKRVEQEKIAKNKPKAKTSVVVEKEIDPFNLDSVKVKESGTYDKDDDFM